MCVCVCMCACMHVCVRARVCLHVGSVNVPIMVFPSLLLPSVEEQPKAHNHYSPYLGWRCGCHHRGHHPSHLLDWPLQQ